MAMASGQFTSRINRIKIETETALGEDVGDGEEAASAAGGDGEEEIWDEDEEKRPT